MEVLVSPEQIEKYERSEDARNAIKLFGLYDQDSGPLLNRQDYCTMRDYLYWQISLQNSHRSGVCSNLTLAEFQKAACEDGMVRIKVAKHKTAREYGTAKLYLKPHIFRYMKIFVEKVRRQVIGFSPHVFTSFNGKQMSSGQVSKQINATWQRAGVYGDSNVPSRNVTCTILRKSASTAVLEHNPEVAKDVAELLLHSEKTQRKYYNSRRRELSTARGAQYVGNLLRYRTINPEARNDTCQVEEMPVKEMEGDEKSKNQSGYVGSPKKKWSQDELDEIKLLFADNLKEEAITMTMVKVMEEDFKMLKSVPLRKIYWKIRSLWKSNKVEEVDTEHETLNSLPAETPQEKFSRFAAASDDDDYVPPSLSSVSFGKEKVFSTNNSALIKRLCKSLIDYGGIGKSGVKAALENSPEGREVLRTFSITSIINRVKYERRLNK